MLSNYVSRPTCNAISYAKTVHRKPCPRYSTLHFTCPHQNIINTLTVRTDTMHWNKRLLVILWPTVHATIRCSGNPKFRNGNDKSQAYETCFVHVRYTSTFLCASQQPVTSVFLPLIGPRSWDQNIARPSFRLPWPLTLDICGHEHTSIYFWTHALPLPDIIQQVERRRA
jgi:hypothetical protein